MSNGNPLSTHVDDQALRRPYPFTLAPLITPDTPAHRLVNNSYIVVLKQGLAQSQVLAHLDGVHNDLFSSDLMFRERRGLSAVLNMPGLQGYSGSFSEDTLHALRAHPEVDFIEREQLFHTMDYDAQKNAPWVCSSPCSAYLRILTSIQNRDLLVSRIVTSLVYQTSRNTSTTMTVVRVLMCEF